MQIKLNHCSGFSSLCFMEQKNTSKSQRDPAHSRNDLSICEKGLEALYVMWCTQLCTRTHTHTQTHTPFTHTPFTLSRLCFPSLSSLSPPLPQSSV